MSHAHSLQFHDALLRRQIRLALGDAYHLGRELERGGMGRLFVATPRGAGPQVVVKVLPRAEADAEAEARFRREVAVTSALRHPNVLPMLAAGETPALLFYVSPYVGGGSLRDRLTHEATLPPADVVRLLCELAGALAHAHAHGVVHGDVKPENVLLDDGRALLADFGAARLRGRAAGGAAPIVGTPLYMSPEQAAGDPGVDARSDVYSLAVVGFELLTGRTPFAGLPPRLVLLAHLGQPVPRLRTLRPDVPPTLAAVLERALGKAPSSRFASAAAFRLALAESLRPSAWPAVARRSSMPTVSSARRTVPARVARRRGDWGARAAGVLLPLVATAGAAALSAVLLGGTLGAAGATRVARADAWPAAPSATAAAPIAPSGGVAAQHDGHGRPRTAHRLAVVVVRGGERTGVEMPAFRELRVESRRLRDAVEGAVDHGRSAALEARAAADVLDGIRGLAGLDGLDLRALARVHAAVDAACPERAAAARAAANGTDA